MRLFFSLEEILLRLVCAGEYYQYRHHYCERCCYNSCHRNHIEHHTIDNNKSGNSYSRVLRWKEGKKQAMEGKIFLFSLSLNSVLLSSGEGMIEKFTLVIIVTIRKAEVPSTYMCICVGKGERVKQQEKKRDEKNKRRIENLAQYIFLPPLFLSRCSERHWSVLLQPPAAFLIIIVIIVFERCYCSTHTHIGMHGETRDYKKREKWRNMYTLDSISNNADDNNRKEISNSVHKALKCHWHGEVVSWFHSSSLIIPFSSMLI